VTAARTVVVGVDGTLMARIALDWAIAQARARGWAVHVVHAWSARGGDLAWLPAQYAHRESVALLTDTLRDADESGVALTCASVEGDPAAVLVEQSRGAALLVLAAHGGPRHGPVVATCLRTSSVPVVVVPPPFAIDEFGSAEQAGPAAPAEGKPR
jgi:nucleotide-binding universal stress UspA family protein